jgi:L-ascorbate metabolism protein UlaG (beta-lactamase superfamily)
MEIKYLGHASFLIKAKEGKVVTDPFDPKIGLKYPKQEADIVTVSHHHSDHNNVTQVGPSPLVLDWPGEFEKQGIRIFGFQSYHDKQKGAERGENVLYKIEAEGISILHCGDLGVIPNDDLIDEIGEVDILMVPVGGYYTIDSSEAVELIKKIDPSVVIPMHYGRTELNPETFGNLTPVSDFLKKMGIEGVEAVDKFVVKQGDFGDEMKVVVMKIST